MSSVGARNPTVAMIKKKPLLPQSARGMSCAVDEPPSINILPAHTPALFEAAVRRAALHLRRGSVVVLPTETVYGLAANALNPEAVALLYSIKGRPANNPVIVHVSSLEMARSCVQSWPESASRLASAFWPGPLTLVLPRSTQIPDIVTAGGNTVALRFPSHPMMRAVIEACGFPLAAPSANLSSQVSPTTASHCAQALEGRVTLIVDGGPCQIGIESTVIDLTLAEPRLLRPGMISADSIRAILMTDSSTWPSGVGDAAPTMPGGEPLRSPGMFAKHYAPQARLLVWSWKNEQALQDRIATMSPEQDPVHVIAHTEIPLELQRLRSPVGVSVIPHDPEAFGRALYSELHDCDARGVTTLIIETVPNSPRWEGIADRLRRAASEFETGRIE